MGDIQAIPLLIECPIKEGGYIQPHTSASFLPVSNLLCEHHTPYATMVTTRSNKRGEHASEPSRPIIPIRKTTKPTDANPKSPLNKYDKQAKSDTIKKMNQLLTNLHSASSTICPSQVARGLNKDHPARYPDWRGMMDFTRDIVWEHVKEGRVEVTQGGEVRTYEEREGLKGPIRVRRGEGWDSG